MCSCPRGLPSQYMYKFLAIDSHGTDSGFSKVDFDVLGSDKLLPNHEKKGLVVYIICSLSGFVKRNYWFRIKGYCLASRKKYLERNCHCSNYICTSTLKTLNFGSHELACNRCHGRFRHSNLFINQVTVFSGSNVGYYFKILFCFIRNLGLIPLIVGQIVILYFWSYSYVRQVLIDLLSFC